MPVPGDCFTRIERVLAHQNIDASRNDMYVADFIRLRPCLAHLSPFGLFRLDADLCAHVGSNSSGVVGPLIRACLMFPLPASSTGTQHNQDTLKLFDPTTRSQVWRMTE